MGPEPYLQMGKGPSPQRQQSTAKPSTWYLSAGQASEEKLQFSKQESGQDLLLLSGHPPGLKATSTSSLGGQRAISEGQGHLPCIKAWAWRDSGARVPSK